MSIGSGGEGCGSMGGGPLSEVLERAARREDDAKNDAGFPCLECCGTFVVVLLAAFGVLLLDDDMTNYIGWAGGVPVVRISSLVHFADGSMLVESSTFPPVSWDTMKPKKRPRCGSVRSSNHVPRMVIGSDQRKRD